MMNQDELNERDEEADLIAEVEQGETGELRLAFEAAFTDEKKNTTLGHIVGRFIREVWAP